MQRMPWPVPALLAWAASWGVFLALLDGLEWPPAVAVLSADAFAIGQHAVPHAVRINLAAARSRSGLRRGLELLVEVMRSAEHHVSSRV